MDDVQNNFSSLNFETNPPPTPTLSSTPALTSTSNIPSLLPTSISYTPAFPLEIIHLLADTFFPTTVVESSELAAVGRSLSLVCRSWRSIGQSLLFRHISIRSLSSTCPRLQHFLSPSFAHASRIQLLLVDVSGSELQSSSLLPLLDRCRNLKDLALYGPPRDVSHNVKDLSLSSARHTVTTLALVFEQVQNRPFEEYDVEDFLSGIDNLAALEDVQIQIPVVFGRLLSPFEHRIKVAKFSLCICSSNEEAPKEAEFEHTTMSILSLLATSHLKELKLLPTTLSQSFVNSLPTCTSLSSITLVSFDRYPTKLMKSLDPVLSSLLPLQHLSLRAMEEEEEEQEEEEETPFPESTTSTFLRRLPPHLKTLDFDFSVHRSTVELIEKVLENRREEALKRVTRLESVGGKPVYRHRVKCHVDGMKCWI
ncbi:hypothetical protein JCM5353_007745 [Sporobolomyces roseus]